MKLWFTTFLETLELPDDESASFSSPFRVNFPDGAVTWYRLTPDSLDWIRRMLGRAEKKAGTGGLSADILVNFKRRYTEIQQWADLHFTPAELAEMPEAARRAEGLPKEPGFGFAWK